MFVWRVRFLNVFSIFNGAVCGFENISNSILNYDPSLSFFDNTFWTYGTDYGLCIVMTLVAISILNCDHQYTIVSRQLRFRSAGLLLLYAASVFAGGVAHQTYLSFESRQTISFRVLWTICVGTVCAASGFMGCIGSELARQYAKSGPIPVIHESFWIGFGVMTTLICLLGGFSYQRPACDIFIAGTTQFMSTFYVMLLLTFQFDPTTDPSCVLIRKKYRVVGFIGFILNAPLLPLYPILVTYTNWSLGLINTLLHTNLLTAWCMQGLSLKHIAATLATSKSKPKLAVPVPATLQHRIPSTLHSKYHDKQS